MWRQVHPELGSDLRLLLGLNVCLHKANNRVSTVLTVFFSSPHLGTCSRSQWVHPTCRSKQVPRVPVILLQVVTGPSHLLITAVLFGTCYLVSTLRHSRRALAGRNGYIPPVHRATFVYSFTSARLFLTLYIHKSLIGYFTYSLYVSSLSC